MASRKEARMRTRSGANTVNWTWELSRHLMRTVFSDLVKLTIGPIFSSAVISCAGLEPANAIRQQQSVVSFFIFWSATARRRFGPAAWTPLSVGTSTIIDGEIYRRKRRQAASDQSASSSAALQNYRGLVNAKRAAPSSPASSPHQRG